MFLKNQESKQKVAVFKFQHSIFSIWTAWQLGLDQAEQNFTLSVQIFVVKEMISWKTEGDVPEVAQCLWCQIEIWSHAD